MSIYISKRSLKPSKSFIAICEDLRTKYPPEVTDKEIAEAADRLIDFCKLLLEIDRERKKGLNHEPNN